jgi:hypothetical protein
MANNAEFYGITVQAGAAMGAAMDEAAREFWAYPDERWQLAFEAKWLHDHGYEAEALTAHAVLDELAEMAA